MPKPVMYTKRNASNPSELVKLEYQMLANKLTVIARNGGSEDYYASKCGVIEMSWLENDALGDLDNKHIWHASMPIPFWQCVEIFNASKKMPKKSVLPLIFPDYDLDASELGLFDVIFEYGRAKGLLLVADKLFEGAEMGDPRAVKMYLELVGVIGVEDDEDDRVKKLMRVNLNI